MRRKYIRRKNRLLTRAVPWLLAALIVFLTFTLRPHFGQTTFNDSWTDDVNDFRANEVALDYNASLVFAPTGRLFFANGGLPGSPPPPPPPPMSPPGNGDGLRDTWVVNYTTGGVTYTQTGHF
jgi:hypothetical protein